MTLQQMKDVLQKIIDLHPMYLPYDTEGAIPWNTWTTEELAEAYEKAHAIAKQALHQLEE
jgi:hypothetical protein